jgi:hypothetical protein
VSILRNGPSSARTASPHRLTSNQYSSLGPPGHSSQTSFESSASSSSSTVSGRVRGRRTHGAVSPTEDPSAYKDLFTLPHASPPQLYRRVSNADFSNTVVPSLDGLVEQLDILDPEEYAYQEQQQQHQQAARKGRAPCQDYARQSSYSNGSSSGSSGKQSRMKHSEAVVMELEEALGTSIDLDSEDDEESDGRHRLPFTSPSTIYEEPSTTFPERHRIAATTSHKPMKRTNSPHPSPLRKHSSPPASAPPYPPSSRLRGDDDDGHSATMHHMGPLLSYAPGNVQQQQQQHRRATPGHRQRTNTLPMATPHPRSPRLSPPLLSASPSSSPASSTILESGEYADHYHDGGGGKSDSDVEPRNKFDQLVNYLLASTERDAAERSVMEGRMKSLEAEVQRREKELQGMRYLLMNNTGSGAMRSPGRGK